MREKKQPVITAQTLIPIGTILAVIGIIISGVVKVTTIDNLTQANTADIALLRADIVSVQAQNTNVVDRLARVETKLDAILQELTSND